jgi:hypothetical protein
MQAILVDDRLDLGQFGDLMDQGAGILAVQGVAAATAGTGLTVPRGAELLTRDQGSEGLGMAGLSPAFPPGRGSGRFSFQADGVGGRWLGGVGGVELESGLEIAKLGFQLGNPILEGFPGVPEGRLSLSGNGVPEWFRDRRLVVHIQLRAYPSRRV